MVLLALSLLGVATGGSLICEALAAARTSGAGAVMPPLVIYSDFQCPGCRDLDADLRPIRMQLPIVYRHFPIDIACKGNIRATRHPGSCLQARAAICAGDQGRYYEISDRIFGRFDATPNNKTLLIELASAIGLDRERFSSCLDDLRTDRSLKERIDAGARAGRRPRNAISRPQRPPSRGAP